MSSLGLPHIGAQMRRGGLSADSQYNRITNMKSRKDPKEMKPKVIPFELGEYEEEDDGYLFHPLEELKELISEDSRGNIVRLLKLPKEIAKLGENITIGKNISIDSSAIFNISLLDASTYHITIYYITIYIIIGDK